MVINRNSNNFKKCLGVTYILSTVIITLIIIYLEKTPRELFFHNAELLDVMTREDKLFNLTDFRIVVGRKNTCPRDGKDVLAVVIVTSYAGDVETRSAVRRAYPSKLLAKFRLRRVFLLALIDEAKNVNRVSQAAIEDENNRFHDIVQGSFIEDYRNLTYKHVMGLRWVVESCFQAKYVIKMDHDIIFDYYKLTSTLLKVVPKSENLLAGYIMTNMKPVREPANKWYVSYKEYLPQTYPNFLSGWFYITNPMTCKVLYHTSQQVPYFWIDDLYVTGLLVQKLNISFVKLNKYFTTHPEYLQCCIQKPKLSCDYAVGPTGGNNSLMLAFQKYSESCFYRSCKKRTELNSLHNTCIAKWKDEPFGKGKAFVNMITFNN